MKNPIVSIIMPVYNEEKYIKNCIESLLKQDFPKEKSEWLFVDGLSSDKTKQIISEYSLKYPNLIKIYDNPNKIVPFAMNIGINESKGKYIIRLDAHADYQNDYIKKCVYYLENIDADNVGGIAETKSNGLIGESIALMLSSKFGVGNSKFRINSSSGYVDTVPFGAFKKEVFDKIGLYDIRLIRNQDNELNYRIIKNGGKIYLSDDIRFSYYCRDSVISLIRMALDNGKWNIITNKLCPGSMKIRHFIPLVFVLSLICFLLLSIFTKLLNAIFFMELILYLSLDIYYSIVSANQMRKKFILFFLFPIFHISYGIGSLIGICKIKNYN